VKALKIDRTPRPPDDRWTGRRWARCLWAVGDVRRLAPTCRLPHARSLATRRAPQAASFLHFACILHTHFAICTTFLWCYSTAYPPSPTTCPTPPTRPYTLQWNMPACTAVRHVAYLYPSLYGEHRTLFVIDRPGSDRFGSGRTPPTPTAAAQARVYVYTAFPHQHLPHITRLRGLRHTRRAAAGSTTVPLNRRRYV